MTEGKGGKKQSPGKSGGPATPESVADLEGVLVSFVQTFESSAKRWEQTIYLFISEALIYSTTNFSGCISLYMITGGFSSVKVIIRVRG